MTYGELFIGLLSIGALADIIITMIMLLLLKFFSTDKERE